MKPKEKQRVCDNCGHQNAELRRVTRTYGHGKQLLVIENVPVVRCTYCGESYLTAETVQQIERIKRHRQDLAVSRPIEVASFAK